jgi:AraC-like DNA-binding protein
MPVDLTEILLVLGAGQGIFLAAVLATRRTNARANRLLALAMLAFSIYITQPIYYAHGLAREFPHLIGVSLPLIFLFGPLLYLYAVAVASGGRDISARSLLHFVPTALVLLWFSSFYFGSAAEKIAFVERIERLGKPLDLVIAEYLQYPHGITYVALTIRLLRRHQARLLETRSSIEHINLRWLRNLTVAIAAIWALATGIMLFNLAGITIPGERRLIELAVSAFVYGIGYFGLGQPEIFLGRRVRTGTTDAHPIPAAATASAPSALAAVASESSIVVEEDEEEPGYEKSGLTPEEAELRTTQLLRIMTERQLYKRSELTLQELAEEMDISPHNLSEILNTRIGKNFYDFVNGYRVEEAMRRLRDPRLAHLTVLAIAEESGFNSKSTFNAFFRNHTGLTPSKYRSAQHLDA